MRAARADDVPKIARIQVDTWRIAYRHFLPASVLEALSFEQAAAAWGAAVDTPPTAAHRVLVATEQDFVVGFAAGGPSAEQDAAPGEAAIAVLLVEPRWGRRGHGSRLLAATVEHFRAEGVTRLVAWVPDGDSASTSFFSSAGWERDGTVRTLETDLPDGGTVRETRWHVSLADPPEGVRE